jgi:hypothetical protein
MARCADSSVVKFAVLFAVLSVSACLGAQANLDIRSPDSDVEIRFADSESYSFTPEDRAVMTEIVRDTVSEVRALLPQLPSEFAVTIETGDKSLVVPETGEAGRTMASGEIVWGVDPSRPEGAIGVAEAHLRSTLFHEMHHMARGWLVGGPPPNSFMDAVVSEGMATAFERDFTHTDPLWGDYPAEVDDWVEELLELPLSAYAQYRQWMFQHPDGRRYVGYRAGTYIVDQAMEKSGLTSAELVDVPTDEILSLAGYR